MISRDAYSVLEIGEHVEYWPRADRCRINAALLGYDGRIVDYYPWMHSKWRVFRKVDGRVELFDPDGVLSIGMYGSNAYTNLGTILKLISESYVNPWFAESGRSLGYKPEFVDVVGISTELRDDFPYRDNFYCDDVEHVKKYNLLPSRNGIWLPSRDCTIADSGYSLKIRTLESDGAVESKEMFYAGLDFDVNHYSYSRIVCPVIRLKPGILVLGEGTRREPYRLTWKEYK